MDLLDDLGSDIVIAVFVDKKFTEQIESTEVLPLISKLKDALRTVSEKDHLHGEYSSQTVVTSH